MSAGVSVVVSRLTLTASVLQSHFAVTSSTWVIETEPR
jgi:hypothetical protein